MEAAKKIFTRAHIIWFLLLNFGLVLLAAGIHFFKSPNNFAMGGTSGISIIAATLLPHMDVGTFMFIINGVLIVLGLVFLGRAVIGATLYSSVALSFYVWVLERAVPMARPFTDDTFLELCYAVILPAAGSAIIFNIGASSGGTDIIAMILPNTRVWRSARRCSFRISASRCLPAGCTACAQACTACWACWPRPL